MKRKRWMVLLQQKMMSSANLDVEVPKFSPKDITKEGWLYKKSRNLGMKRKRWMVLLQHQFFFLSFKEEQGYLDPTESFPITLETRAEVSEQPEEFLLHMGETIRVFTSDSQNTINEWVKAINDVVEFLQHGE